MVSAMDVESLRLALLAEEPALLKKLATLILEHQLQQPLQTCVSQEQARELVGRLLQPATLELTLQTELTSALERALDVLTQSDEPLGVWVGAETRAQLVALLARPEGPRFPYMADVISPALLRNLLAPVFQDVLLSFVARVSSVVGLSGREVSDRSKRWMEFGRNLVGGLGIDEKLRVLAEEFSQQAVATFRTQLQTRLAQPEGQQALRALLEHALTRWLEVPLHELCTDAGRLPPAEITALLPPAVAHASNQPLFEVLLDQELQAFYDKYGSSPLSKLLTDLAIETDVKTLFITAMERNARPLVATPAFADWLAELLTTAS